MIKELSSTQKMKQDVEQTLQRLRRRNHSINFAAGEKRGPEILDKESQMLLDQFNKEYQLMKKQIVDIKSQKDGTPHKESGGGTRHYISQQIKTNVDLNKAK